MLLRVSLRLPALHQLDYDRGRDHVLSSRYGMSPHCRSIDDCTAVYTASIILIDLINILMRARPPNIDARSDPLK